MLQLARLNACDRVVLKLNRVGGFFEALKIVSICESAGIGVSVDTNPYTLIGDTAVCHIAATCRVHYPVDCEGHQSFLDWGGETLVSGGVRIADGRAHLSDDPGLGVEVDWEALKRHQELGYETLARVVLEEDGLSVRGIEVGVAPCFSARRQTRRIGEPFVGEQCLESVQPVLIVGVAEVRIA